MIARAPDADRPLLDLLDAAEAGRAANDQAVKFLEAQRGREESETKQGERTDLPHHANGMKLTQGSNQSAYLLRRLSRMDGDWLARYEAGEFPSVRAAAIAAGVAVDDQAVAPAPPAEPTIVWRPGALAAIAPRSPAPPPAPRPRAPRPAPRPARRPVTPAPAGVVTVAELLKRYAIRRRLSERTVSLYAITVRHFAEFLGHEPTVDDLDDDRVSEYLVWRSEQPCRGRKVSPASVEKCRVQLLAVWRFGARKRLVAEFPDVAGWRVPRRVRDAYTVDDLDRLLAYVATLRGTRRTTGTAPRAWWWRTLVLAAFQTGERRGGLFGLRWRDVDLDACRVVFRAETRKGGREDIVRAITPELADELRQHVGADADLVWPWCGSPLSVYPQLKTLCRRAGVPYFALHGIRRTSASYVARGGGDATAHLGHSSPAVTRAHYLVPEIAGASSGLDHLPRIGEGSKQQ